MTTFDEFYRDLQGNPPPDNVGDRLKAYWERPVRELCTLAEPPVIDEEAKERHRLYATALMSIVWHYWCGNKRGRGGEYPLNAVAEEGDPAYLDGDYRGHNIAALAVGADGHVLDFDFNHNELFRSSAEHAEARLVRRLYSLAQVSEAWNAADGGGRTVGSAARPSRISLDEVTVYTTLESCSQCSGIMALAKVKEVVYLQTDPGMYFIGRILRNLTPDDLRAPLPIGGGEIGLPEFAELDAAFEAFPLRLKDTPFWQGSDGDEDRNPSMTSFLCTAGARAIYARARARFLELADQPEGTVAPANRRLASELRAFVEYATTLGYRATPHNL